MTAITTGKQASYVNSNYLEAVVFKALPHLSSRAWEFACANPEVALAACNWLRQQKVGCIDAFASDARAFHNNSTSDDLSVLFSMPPQFRPILAPWPDSELDELEDEKQEIYETFR